MSSVDLSSLILEVDKRHLAAIESNRRAGIQRLPRASAIGECAREIYHSIVDPGHRQTRTVTKTTWERLVDVPEVTDHRQGR